MIILMKILVTGTHFTTAVAVIEELKKQTDVEIVYVGRKTTREGDSSTSVESRVLPQMGVKFIPIITGRLQRALSVYTIPSLLKIPIGVLQAFFILLREKPDVILSFGGYVAVPMVVAGWLLSIPIIIHEQTLVSGLANTICSFFADKIAISFENNNNFNKGKTILTGNPLRKEILNYDKSDLSDSYKSIFTVAQKNDLPVILITGGNQGSHAINKVAEDCLKNLLKIACVIHQTGDSKFQDYERLSERQSDRYIVSKFIYQEMAYVLKNVDLSVSRAGINTLSELAYLGTPALVIPVPYLYKDEQNKNAKYFERLGLVKTLSQKSLNSKSLLENIKFMINDLDNLKNRAKNAKEIIIPDAAKRLALETLLLAKKM